MLLQTANGYIECSELNSTVKGLLAKLKKIIVKKDASRTRTNGKWCGTI